jgi:hypothetical protein
MRFLFLVAASFPWTLLAQSEQSETQKMLDSFNQIPERHSRMIEIDRDTFIFARGSKALLLIRKTNETGEVVSVVKGLTSKISEAIVVKNPTSVFVVDVEDRLLSDGAKKVFELPDNLPPDGQELAGFLPERSLKTHKTHLREVRISLPSSESPAERTLGYLQWLIGGVGGLLVAAPWAGLPLDGTFHSLSVGVISLLVSGWAVTYRTPHHHYFFRVNIHLPPKKFQKGVMVPFKVAVATAAVQLVPLAIQNCIRALSSL